MSNQSVIEALESRTLMSAAPVLFNSVVKADRAVVQAELAKFSVDIAYCSTRLTADDRLNKAGVKGVAGAPALITTLKSNIRLMRTQLKIDRLTQEANALTQEAVIKLDIRQILIDKKDTSAETTDHAKLLMDRATLQNVLITGLRPGSTRE